MNPPILEPIKKSKVKFLNFTKFDPLNSKYDILQFQHVQVRKKFRYNKKWLLKSGPDWAFHKDSKLGGLRMDYKVDKDKFVLIIKDSPLDHKS